MILHQSGRIVSPFKRCNKCAKVLHLSSFSKHTHAPDGKRYTCRSCSSLESRSRRLKKPEQYSSYYHEYKRRPEVRSRVHAQAIARYGLTPNDYQVLLDSQDSQCAICGSTHSSDKKLVVDHDHVTGEVRGLLCHKCNRALGVFGDTVQGLERALRYLKGELRNE